MFVKKQEHAVYRVCVWLGTLLAYLSSDQEFANSMRKHILLTDSCFFSVISQVPRL